MKKTIQLLGLLLVVFSGALQAQKEFTGTMTYSYTFEGEDVEMFISMMPEKMIVQYGDRGIITHMEGGLVASMMGIIVVDTENQISFIKKESEKSIYLVNDEDAEEMGEGMESSEVKTFDETKEIMGYTCYKYETETTDANGQTLKQTIWATKDLKLKKYDFSGKAKELMANAYNEKLKDALPMEVEVFMPAMEMTLKLTVTNIEKSKIPSERFDIPKGYAQKDISEMLGQ
ncbi:MAG: DUF4412 domain-containing protein [Saprospiraceae bacterium]|nr:DUF4412 domain-containing protein [Saprospiraceae bacterium]